MITTTRTTSQRSQRLSHADQLSRAGKANPTVRAAILSLVFGLCSLLMAPSQAQAHGSSELNLFGGLTTEQVPCDTLCTQGPLTGGLEGFLEFTMDSMEETNDPDVVRFVGVNTITTDEGTLVGTDYGIWNLATGHFHDFTIFTKGTGKFRRYRGTLVIVGTFDVVGGTGQSNYYSALHKSFWSSFYDAPAMPQGFGKGGFDWN